MMMQNPNDNLFKDLLSDYAAPVTDDGFSASVLKIIEAETRKVERIRRFSIYGACFVGGLIAASQFPELIAMIAKIKIAAPTLPDTGSIPLSQWSWSGIILLGFVLWAALDRKTSDIF
jgi:LPXTG-motif cell wall-anchored protein